MCVRSIAMHDEGMLLTMNSYISEQILYLLCVTSWVTSIDKLEMCCGTSILRHSNFDSLRLNEISTEHWIIWSAIVKFVVHHLLMNSFSFWSPSFLIFKWLQPIPMHSIANCCPSMSVAFPVFDNSNSAEREMWNAEILLISSAIRLLTTGRSQTKW